MLPPAVRPVTCGDEITLTTRNINNPYQVTSPNYPATYPPFSNCTNIFKPPALHRVMLTIHDIDVEECCDYIGVCF